MPNIKTPTIKTPSQTPAQPHTRAKIVVLISGSGSNLKSILDRVLAYTPPDCPVEIAAVIADRAAPGLAHAERLGIPTHIFDKKQQQNPSKDAHIHRIDEICSEIDPLLIVLAGFLSILPAWFTKKWPQRITNIHPSLLPKHGGVGMYGIKVHESVLQSKDSISGCTVHWVSEIVDGGAIIGQAQVAVLANDTPELLQQRVLAVEHRLYPQIIIDLANAHLANTNLTNTSLAKAHPASNSPPDNCHSHAASPQALPYKSHKKEQA